ASRIGHGGPGFLGLQMPVLQKLDGDAVGRADKGHMAVTRRAVDGHAPRHQLLAQSLYVTDLVGEMAKIASAAIALLVPVISEFDDRAFIRAFAHPLGVFGRSEENQRETALFIFHT